MTTFFVAITVAALAFIGAAKQSKRRSRKNSKSRKADARRMAAVRAAKREVAAMAREVEREHKARQKRELAALELQQICDQRTGLLNLYRALESEYNHSKTESRRTTLTRQMLSVDEKIARLDLKRAKLFQQIEAA